MAVIDRTDIRTRTIEHYRDRFEKHGATPSGVDWNGPESQEAHFAELLKLLPANPEAGIDIVDFGCGYGALAGYLAARVKVARYCGYDINQEMIAAAQEAYPSPPFSFEVADSPLRVGDFAVASGVFTLRLNRTDEECWEALLEGLAALDRASRRGFSFNCLTSYSDKEKMRDYLYYPDPCRVFDHCKKTYSREVALLHDYGLFAFTILVRKDVRQTR